MNFTPPTPHLSSRFCANLFYIMAYKKYPPPNKSHQSQSRQSNASHDRKTIYLRCVALNRVNEGISTRICEARCCAEWCRGRMLKQRHNKKRQHNSKLGLIVWNRAVRFVAPSQHSPVGQPSFPLPLSSSIGFRTMWGRGFVLKERWCLEEQIAHGSYSTVWCVHSSSFFYSRSDALDYY